MKKIPAIIVLATAALLRCGEDVPKRPAAPPPRKPELLHVKGPDDSDDRNNLLNIAHGAVVISRTGEVSLQYSAQCAIDGDPSTVWVSPPDEPDQSLVFALPAKARVRSLGVLIGSEASFPKSTEFEGSLDGKRFTRITSFAMPASGTNLVDVTPFEAKYVRFNTRGGNQFVRAVSVFARGDLLEPVRPGSLDGCWSINGLDASFAQHGASVTGAVAGPQTLTIDGGSDGRFYRLLWLRGPEYGIAAVAVSPDGQHLSGVFWHEESYPPFLTTTWFGDRRSCGKSDPKPELDVLATSMQRYGRYAMYGLQFDAAGKLLEEPSRPMLERLAIYLRTNPNVRIVAHELLQADDAHDRSVSQTKIESLRAALAASAADLKNVEFVAVGSDSPHRPASTDAARSIYGAVELVKRQ